MGPQHCPKCDNPEIYYVKIQWQFLERCDKCGYWATNVKGLTKEKDYGPAEVAE